MTIATAKKKKYYDLLARMLHQQDTILYIHIWSKVNLFSFR